MFAVPVECANNTTEELLTCMQDSVDLTCASKSIKWMLSISQLALKFEKLDGCM